MKAALNGPNIKKIACFLALVAVLCISAFLFRISQAPSWLGDELQRTNRCIVSLAYVEFFYRTEEKLRERMTDGQIEEFIRTDLSKSEDSFYRPKGVDYDYLLGGRDTQYIYLTVIGARGAFNRLFASSEPQPSIDVIRYGFPLCMIIQEELAQHIQEVQEQM